MSDMKDAEMETIRHFVSGYRSGKRIVPTVGSKPEQSRIMPGEFYNLLYTQLIPSLEIEDDTGDGWAELENDEIRECVLREIGFYNSVRAA